jgi:GH24 family phage-related lysozyme (muramidase)
MKINDAGLKLIKSFEGLHLNAYLCSAGIWTIGYGHTRNAVEGSVITELEAEKLLLEDLQDAQSAVDSLVTVELNANQYSALVSFIFNVGFGAFFESTLLKMLNDGDYQGAADQLLRWDKVGKQKVPGLTRRRVLERRLFLS